MGKKKLYSSLGLDKFSSLNAELSAKREYVARKTGSEAMVRFAYTPRGWVPVVVKNGKDGGISILPCLRAKQDNQGKENYNSIQKEEDRNHRVKATAFSSPKNNDRSQELNTQPQGKKKKFGRIVSMDGQPRKPIRLQQSDSFVRRGAERVEIDATVGAAVMIILLFFLVFYGKFCAICFTSTWWYVLPNLRTEYSNSSSSHNNNSRVVLDLQSKEYKKKVIMDGLLDRNHGRAI